MRRTVIARNNGPVNSGGLRGGNGRKMGQLGKSNKTLKMGWMHAIKLCLF